LKPKWGDYVLAGAVMLASLLLSYNILFAKPGSPPTAVITMNGEVIGQVVLTPGLERQIIELKGGRIVIEAQSGRIRFTESDCTNKVCINTGWIGTPGQIAACLPNKALIKITGDENDLDVVVQ